MLFPVMLEIMTIDFCGSLINSTTFDFTLFLFTSSSFYLRNKFSVKLIAQFWIIVSDTKWALGIF